MGNVCAADRTKHVHVVLKDEPAHKTDWIEPDLGYRLEKLLLIKAAFCLRSKKGFVKNDAISSLLLKHGIEDRAIHDYMCRHYDSDYNGKLDYIEFHKFMVSVADVHKKFISADQNRDEKISLDEIQSILSDKHITLSEDAIALLMDRFDMNSDGVLTYAEFFLLLIFLGELQKVFANFQSSRKIAADKLCKLIDDQATEESTADELNKYFGKFKISPTLDSFTLIILHYKQKFRCSKTRGKVECKRHVHALDSMTKSGEYKLEEPWNDESFDPKNPDILPNHVLESGPISWFRPFEMHPKSELFVDGVEDRDVIQGHLNDCWFLGALAVVAAKSPETIRRLFHHSNCEKGVYVCRFFRYTQWVRVEIDDRLPCIPCVEHRVPYFAYCRDESEFWVPLLEKAYAKLHGSYAALEYGDTDEALKDLTGSATLMIILHKDRDPEAQWKRLCSLVQQNCILGCAIDIDNNAEIAICENKGLMAKHAYSLLWCDVVDGVKLILLRNPWTKKEWNGDWSDTSPLWTQDWQTKEFIKNHKHKFEEDGRFYMCFEDFIQFFNRIYAALPHPFDEHKQIIEGKWDRNNSKGCHEHPYWYCNPRYVIKTTEPNTTFVVNLTQQDLRKTFSVNGLQGKYEQVGLYLIESGTENKTMQFFKVLNEPVFTDTRDTSLEYKSTSANSSFILLPCTHQPEREGKYTISIYADKQIQLEELRPIAHSKLNSRWMRGLASASMFLLTCFSSGNVDVLLVPKCDTTMQIGIKVYEGTSDKWAKHQQASITGPSICVSFAAKQNVEYLIDPSAAFSNVPSIEFEITVYSDHIANFALYVQPGMTTDSKSISVA